MMNTASLHESYATREFAAMEAKLNLAEARYDIECELVTADPFGHFWIASLLAESYAARGYQQQAWRYLAEAASYLAYINDTGWAGTWCMPLAANHFIVASAFLGARWESVRYQIMRACDAMVAEFPLPLSQLNPADSKAEENAWRGAFYLLADAFTKGGPYATHSYWRGDFFVGHTFTFQRDHRPDTIYFNEEFNEGNLAGFQTTNQRADPAWKTSRVTYNHYAGWPAPNYALGGDSAAGELLHGLLAYGLTPAYLQMRNIYAVDTPANRYIDTATGYYKEMGANPCFQQVEGGWVSEWGDNAQYCTSGIALGLIVAEEFSQDYWAGRIRSVYEPLLARCTRYPRLSKHCKQPDMQFIVDLLMVASHAKAHLAWAGWTLANQGGT